MGFNWIEAAGLKICGYTTELPSLDALKRMRAPHAATMTVMHENPILYKYRWRVWTRYNARPLRRDILLRGSHDLFACAPLMSTAVAMAHMQTLDEENIVYFVDNQKMQRADPAGPFDIPRLMREGRTMAPALADDPDGDFFGHR